MLKNSIQSINKQINSKKSKIKNILKNTFRRNKNGSKTNLFDGKLINLKKNEYKFLEKLNKPVNTPKVNITSIPKKVLPETPQFFQNNSKDGLFNYDSNPKKNINTQRFFPQKRAHVDSKFNVYKQTNKLTKNDSTKNIQYRMTSRENTNTSNILNKKTFGKPKQTKGPL